MPPPRALIGHAGHCVPRSGKDDVRLNGIVAPLRSGSGDGFAGASSTCWVPRIELCPILAVALDGRSMPGSGSRVMVGTQSLSWIFLTVPTKTSATRTRLLVFSARVSGIWTSSSSTPSRCPGRRAADIPRCPSNHDVIMAVTVRTSPASPPCARCSCRCSLSSPHLSRQHRPERRRHRRQCVTRPRRSHLRRHRQRTGHHVRPGAGGGRRHPGTTAAAAG